MLVVCGRLGSAAAAEFESAAMRHAPNGSEDVAIDMSGVDYISSASLKVIASLANRQTQGGGRLRLRAPSVAARLALEFSGLEGLVDG